MGNTITLELPENAVLSDIYKAVLEENIKTALVKIPDEVLDELHGKLVDELSTLDHQGLGVVTEADFLEKIEVYLVAAKRINNECNNKKLTFSSCATRQGRYHNFKKSLKTPDVRILPGSTDETPAAVRNAVGQFGPDFSRLFSGYSSNLASKISLSGFNFHNVVINKGVLWGERRITSYVECDERGERNTAYAYGADTKIFFHKPSQVVCTKPVWLCDQEQEFTNKSWKGSISLSIATLTDESSSLARMIGTRGGQVFGPLVMVAGIGYQSFQILQSFSNGEIDKVGMAVEFTRMTGLTAGSVLSFKLAAAACGAGPLGIAVGAVACIGLAVADHFLFKGDEEKVLTKEYKKLQKEVVNKAYSMFDLEEHCTDAELRSAYLEGVRKYHTDRNTDDSDDVVKAVISAYTLLKTIRESS